MKDINFITIGFSGFSFSQMLGIIASGYGVSQAFILFLILSLLCTIPGFLRYGMLQRSIGSELQSHHIKSCFVPSFIAVFILLIGFLIGLYIGF